MCSIVPEILFVWRSRASEAEISSSREPSFGTIPLKIGTARFNESKMSFSLNQGKLSNHRLFWEAPSGSRDLTQARAPHRTITELIFVLDEAHDGYYLLNLQIAPFLDDAAPSRPLIFPVEVS